MVCFSGASSIRHGEFTMLIKKQTLDIAITLLVVLASGNPVVYYWFGKEVVLIGLPVLLFCYGFVRGLKLNKADILIFVAFVLIGLVHFIEFGASVMPATLGFLLKIVTALLLVRTVKDLPRRICAFDVWIGNSEPCILCIPGSAGGYAEKSRTKGGYSLCTRSHSYRIT